MILWLYERTGDARYRAAAETLLRQLEHQPRTSEGGFWHKLIYPWQMWLDGLYMHGSFYAHAARLFGLDGVWDDLANQIRLFHSHARIEDSGLYAHAWDERRVQFWCDAKTGLSPHVWGRAMGWLLAAMADILEVFPAEHPSRGEIVGIFADCANAAANARNRRTGVWRQVLDAPTRAGNYDEASASCLIEYAIAKCVRMGLLDDSFRGVIADAWRGICEQFLIEYKGLLNINKCCEVAGLGGEARRDGSYAYYLSEPIISNELKAVGALIQAGVELNSGYEAQPHLIRGVEG
jgi:unsaturated rhamnogalacturonyl hydrolase